MSDGAHMGIDAKEALGAILGGEQPKKPPMNPVLMRDYLMSQEGPGEYDGTAAYCARLVLQEMLADPSLASLPADTKRDWSNGYSDDAPIIQVGLYDVLKERGVPLNQLGLTGFMWGWAVNAARYCVEMPPVPNGAIVTLGGDSDE